MAISVFCLGIFLLGCVNSGAGWLLGPQPRLLAGTTTWARAFSQCSSWVPGQVLQERPGGNCITFSNLVAEVA